MAWNKERVPCIMKGAQLESFNITEYNPSKTVPRIMTGVELRQVHTRSNEAERKQTNFQLLDHTRTTTLKEIKRNTFPDKYSENLLRHF
jgi:hypothetical protein